MKASFPKAQAILAKRGARHLAGACLSHVSFKLCNLSIRDLPDLPCGMDYRDHWQETWEAEGLTEANLAQAVTEAEECVREILQGEGLADLAAEAEAVADCKFGSRFG